VNRLYYVILASLLCITAFPFTPTAEIPAEDFTHAVFGEEFTATWCVYCPSAAENLMKIYDEIPDEPYYDDQFFFVALITDVNDKADARMEDYPDVTGYPTVIFDGNDEKVSGGQSDTANYENAIDNCAQREDTDISLEIEMEHLGADQLGVSLSMTWNEDAAFGDPTFNGYVRAYIVEKVSRYNNYDGDPYHFGFLDYAFEESVELNPHEEMQLSTIWVGGEHEDKNGNDFSDIEYENINIFVAFFNDESTSSDKYVLETSFAIPPELEISTETGVLSGNINLQGTAISEKSEVQNVLYRWNQEDWIDSGLPPFNGAFDIGINTEGLTNGEHQISVKVTDDGATNVNTLNVEILNDENPPTIEIIAPNEADIVEGIVVLDIETIDDNSIGNVEFKVNQGNWRKMYSRDDNGYIASWNTQEANAGNGEHVITFRSVDKSNNIVKQELNLTVFNEEDVTYPYLEIKEPKEEFYSARINIEAEASDPEGILIVEYRINNGTWKELAYTNNEIYEGTWMPIMDGWHWIDIRAEDNQEYVTIIGLKFETDSTPPFILLNSNTADVTANAEFDLSVDDYSSLNTLRYRINSGPWIELENDLANVQFWWDSTKYDDGECLMQIECTDKWGGTSTLYRNIDVKNKDLIHSLAPSIIDSQELITVSAIIDYMSPESVSIIIAEDNEGVLAEGQKITMYKEGNYYYGDLYFENEGNYIYSIEVDTGHGKLSSYEQNIVVLAKQEIIESDNEDQKIPYPNLISILLLISLIAIRKRD
tara:strand:- start:16648 stop:18948 length:2301 start_codon:yes stop_codon:yes gene_type:complete